MVEKCGDKRHRLTFVGSEKLRFYELLREVTKYMVRNVKKIIISVNYKSENSILLKPVIKNHLQVTLGVMKSVFLCEYIV